MADVRVVGNEILFEGAQVGMLNLPTDGTELQRQMRAAFKRWLKAKSGAMSFELDLRKPDK